MTSAPSRKPPVTAVVVLLVAALAVYLIGQLIVAYGVDHRADALVTQLIAEFPALQNSDPPHTPSVSWGVTGKGTEAIAALHISRVPSREEQDRMLEHLRAHLEATPLTRVDVTFTWENAAQGHQRRTETLSRADPKR